MSVLISVMMPDVASFVKNLGLEELIGSKLNSSDNDLDSSSSKTNEILQEIINSAEKETIQELAELIKLIRRVVYRVLVEEYKDKKDGDWLQAKKGFDTALQDRLQDYLLETEFTNIANQVYTELFDSRPDAGKQLPSPPLSPEALKILIKTARDNMFNFNSGLLFGLEFDKNTKRETKLQITVLQKTLVERLAVRPIDREEHKKLCDYIFNQDVYAKAEKISSSGTPDIKKNLLISFLRIIFYPLKFIVDYLDKKRIYALDALQSWKNAKDKSREKSKEDIVKAGRLFYYDDAHLKGVSLHKVQVSGKKQRYAVFDFFEHLEDPPNGTIIFFHGTQSDIYDKRVIYTYKAMLKGYRVIMMEYPGFEFSEGPLSRENISHVTHELFKDARVEGLIKGDLTVMGQDIGSYYASLLAKKIEQEDQVSCGGLVLINPYNDDLNIFRKIFGDEVLNTNSILGTLPETLPVVLLYSDFGDNKGALYAKKIEEASSSLHFNIVPVDLSKEPKYFHSKSKGYFKNTTFTDKAWDRFSYKLSLQGKAALEDLRAGVYGKKIFIAESVSKVNEKKGIEQQLTSH